ncbi:unnamed protein product [Lasius platythorax]|uniref:Uncharacterized protein n=1 Tax=Lasius platythorax TaxID=488582 RepID=A0AAV2NJ57_9HYME
MRAIDCISAKSAPGVGNAYDLAQTCAEEFQRGMGLVNSTLVSNRGLNPLHTAVTKDLPRSSTGAHNITVQTILT